MGPFPRESQSPSETDVPTARDEIRPENVRTSLR